MKTKRTTHNRIHLRQLCCSGMSSAAIMPDVLQTLKGIIEHQSALFMWFDKYGGMNNMFIDIILPDVLNLYFTEYHNLRNPYGPDLCMTARSEKAVGNYRQVSKQFYKTDMFNLVCRPHNHHFMLDGTIKDKRRPLGGIMLTRERSQKPFSAADEATLNSILPFFEHALKNHVDAGKIEFTEERPVGLIVANKRGDISHISREAQEILFWAYQESMQLGSRLAHIMDILPGQIELLCRKLNAIFSDKACAPPVLEIRHQYGLVTLRAYLLNSINDDHDSIGITVTRHKPTELSMMQRLRDMPLSPRQREVALWMSKGASSQTISDKMGISLTTYRDHVCKIYLKLNISSREELLRILRH
jgi:DNA-binding CsgD family transcriptional regulator